MCRVVQELWLTDLFCSIPLLDLNIFVILKLVLTAKVLGLVNVLGLLGL